MKVWEASVQPVRFNRVPEKIPEKVLEKVPEKVPGSLGAKPSQVQRGPEKVAEQVPEKVLGIFGAGPENSNPPLPTNEQPKHLMFVMRFMSFWYATGLVDEFPWPDVPSNVR